MPEPTVRRSPKLAAPIVIALELQAEQIRGALVNDTGRILALRSTPVKQTTVRATVAAFSKLILELAALPERHHVGVQAIGISLPGIVDNRADRVSFTNHDSFNWERVPLGSMIEKALENSGVDLRVAISASPSREAKMMASAHPTFAIYAHRHAQVAAEAWIGAAAGKANVVLLNLDAPISAGLLLDGRVLHGAGDMSGTAGFFALNETYKDEYATHGALAFEANEAALIRRTLEHWAADSDSLLSQLTLTDPAQLTATTIVRAARSGDPLALRVIAETCGWVARATATLISLLNPEVVVLGGAFGTLLKPFLSDIRREVKLWAAPVNAKQCSVVSAKLGDQAALLGVARLAWLKQ
ncbi:MAG TPA: ROK family protein [Blastocatellia bacterium]|nr:ROK family protein [Blastocatellia bacterium]